MQKEQKDHTSQSLGFNDRLLHTLTTVRLLSKFPGVFYGIPGPDGKGYVYNTVKHIMDEAAVKHQDPYQFVSYVVESLAHILNNNTEDVAAEIARLYGWEVLLKIKIISRSFGGGNLMLDHRTIARALDLAPHDIGDMPDTLIQRMFGRNPQAYRGENYYPQPLSLDTVPLPLEARLLYRNVLETCSSTAPYLMQIHGAKIDFGGVLLVQEELDGIRFTVIDRPAYCNGRTMGSTHYHPISEVDVVLILIEHMRRDLFNGSMFPCDLSFMKKLSKEPVRSVIFSTDIVDCVTKLPRFL